MMIAKIFKKDKKTGKKTYFHGRGRNGTFEFPTFESFDRMMSILERKGRREGFEVDWELEGFR